MSARSHWAPARGAQIRCSAAAPQPALGLRLSVRMHRRRLDRQLAMGARPASSPQTALRARQLTSSPTRRLIARSLRATVRDARAGRGRGLQPVVPLCYESVNHCGETLLKLAAAIECDPVVHACGLARALELITDGASPLYLSDPGNSLVERLRWIGEGLQAPLVSA